MLSREEAAMRDAPVIGGSQEATAPFSLSLTHVVWTLGGVGLLLLVFFDIRTNLPFNDEWMFAWSIKQLSLGHGILKVPDLAPLGLVQLFWGTLVSLGHIDYRV